MRLPHRVRGAGVGGGWQAPDTNKQTEGKLVVTADNRLMTENRGWLEFTPEGIEAHRKGREWMPQEYQLVEVYCVTRDEWGYLGPVACGAACMCAVAYFPPDASDREMMPYRYAQSDKDYAISRECGRGEHDLRIDSDGSEFCKKECGYMTFAGEGVTQ